MTLCNRFGKTAPVVERLCEVPADKTNIQVGTEKLNPLKIKLKLRTIEEEITVHPDAADDRLSPETNTDSMKIDETFFSGLPLEVDYLLPFIDTFTNPAAHGGEGVSN